MAERLPAVTLAKAGTIAPHEILAEMAERTIAPDCKSGGRKAYLGSNPSLGTHFRSCKDVGFDSAN